MLTALGRMMSRDDDDEDKTTPTKNSKGLTGQIEKIGQTIHISGMKLHSKCVYIGKVKNITSYVEIKSDRILFANLHNNILTNKYNIIVPYSEITAMRYCFCSDISIIFIQPIYDSYVKLSNWLQLSKSNQPVSRFIPENFIMIHFDEHLEKDQVKQIERAARECKSGIKIIEINSAFAMDYLNKPNKTFNSKKTTSTSIGNNILKKFKNVEEEVIHLDDEENDSEKNSEKNENDINILNQAILRYPEDESKPIILYGNDLNCLRDGQYLNDNIMNFYLKYFQYNGNITQEIVDKIHIYDALFATHLLNVNTRKRKFTINKSTNYIVYSYDCLEQAYNSVLKKWTKDIDIFAKDFLLIPLVKDGHWFLIILCYIGNVILDNSGIVANKNQAMKKPTIILMDSLANNLNRNDIIDSISSYLSLELKEKRGLEMKSDEFNFKNIYPKVPQQCNYYDCGLFVLEYIERFLRGPEEIYMNLLNNSLALQTWFDARTLNKKRAKIQQIILNLLPPDNAKKLEFELTKHQLNNFNNGDSGDNAGLQ